MALSDFHPAQEPALWIGAIVVVLQTVQKLFNHEPLDADWTQQLLVAVGALAVRQSVVPVAKQAPPAPPAG